MHGQWGAEWKGKVMDKSYIEREYRQAILEFRCSNTEDVQWKMRMIMARLEKIAMEEFGFEYADSLKKLSSINT